MWVGETRRVPCLPVETSLEERMSEDVVLCTQIPLIVHNEAPRAEVPRGRITCGCELGVALRPQPFW